MIRQQAPRVAAILGQNVVASYGSCQFPTLGFVVDRWLEHESFVPETFWKLIGEFAR